MNLLYYVDPFSAESKEENDALKKCIEFETSASSKTVGSNFEPSEIPCAPQNEDEWYRTDSTFIIDPKNPNNLYVSVEWKGLHKSSDGGKTWSLKTKDILLATSGGGGGTLKDQNMHGGGVYETTDGGENWKQKINDTMNGYVTHAFGTLPNEITSLQDKKTRVQNIVWHPTDKNTIFLTGANGHVWKSTNNGTSWSVLLSVDKL